VQVLYGGSSQKIIYPVVYARNYWQATAKQKSTQPQAVPRPDETVLQVALLPITQAPKNINKPEAASSHKFLFHGTTHHDLHDLSERGGDYGAKDRITIMFSGLSSIGKVAVTPFR
jgi:hypothetical protein